MVDKTTAGSRRLQMGVIAVLLVLFVLGAWYVWHELGKAGNKKERTVQTIQVIRPPPPPPPEDKPPPPPPPPEKVEHFEQQQPEPTPNDDPAPAENLALDAAGSAGGDAFGFGSRPGGHDLIGGSGTAPFGAAQARLGSQLRDILSALPCLKGKRVKDDVKVRIGEDGRVLEATVMASTGDASADRCIQTETIGKRVDPLPVEMPQPVRLRIVYKN